MILAHVNSLECERFPLEKFLEVARDILRNNGVSSPVIVDESLKVRENAVICDALRRLGARFVPVSTGRDKTLAQRVGLDDLGFYDEIRPSSLRVFDSPIDLMTRSWPTPLVKINLRGISAKTVVYVKLEGLNPFSMSVKDRVGWYMLINGLSAGKRKILYEATSTNTGLALTLVGNILGFKSRLYIPRPVQKTSEAILRIAGAGVVRREDKSLTVEMIEDVDLLARAEGGIHLNQFENDFNFEVHLRYTAKELDLQLKSVGARPLAIVGGLGTSGHLSALSFYFKSKYGDDVKVVGAQPAPNTSIQGIRRVESGMKWVKYVAVDRIIDVEPSQAVEAVRRVAETNGLLLGPSSGAVIYALQRAYEEGIIPDERGAIVAISPDMGVKYGEYFLNVMNK